MRVFLSTFILTLFVTISYGQAIVDFCYVIDERTGDLFRVGQAGEQVTTIGQVAECRVEAIAWDRIGALYAFDAATTAFYTLNIATSETTLRFDAPAGIRSDNGMAHQVVDVDAMDFDAFDSRILWCVERIPGPSPDLIFSVDVTTGMIVGGMLYPVTGLGISYDIDDIGVHPLTNEIVGIANNDGKGDQLISISTNPGTSGNATIIGNLHTSGGIQIHDMEGFSYDIDGQLIGTTGQCGNPAGSLFAIDHTDGTANLLTTISQCADIESIACFNARIDLDADDDMPIPVSRACIDDCPMLSSCNDDCDEGFTNPTLSITSGACNMVVVSGPCPNGSTLQYSLDALTWAGTAPTTNDNMSAEISIRCSCDTDASVVSTPISAVIDPNLCINVDVQVLSADIEAIPTLTEWSVIILGFLFLIFGVVEVYQKELIVGSRDQK